MRSRPMWRPRSLRGRLWRDLALGLLLSAACYAVAFAIVARAGSDLLSRNGLEGQAEDIGERLVRGPDGGLRVALDARMARLYATHAEHLKYRVLDAHGRVLLSSEVAMSSLPERGRAPVGMQAVTVPYVFEGERYRIQAARSDDYLHMAEEAILPIAVEVSLVSGGVALCVFLLATGWSLRRALAPVRAASKAAMRIGPDTPEARLPRIAMPTEIAPLVDAMNAALERLQEGALAQQRFIANAAHELKTPLTILRGRCELQGCDARLLRGIDHMARLVSQMLHLTEATSPGSYGDPVRVDLERIVEDAIEPLRFAAEARDVNLVLAVIGPSPCTCLAHAPALTIAVRNLVDNAIRHSPAGARIDLRIAPNAISVSDAGPGLPACPPERLFERFWRSEARGHGAGLGLSIVREVMQAHDGTATAHARSDGPGATFRLDWP